MGEIDRKDWEDHHCPGRETVHCALSGLAREKIRQARLDALEEAAVACTGIMRELDDIDCAQFDEYGILGSQFIGAERCIETIRALKDKT